VAQLGARLDGIEEAVGSNPIGSTKSPATFGLSSRLIQAAGGMPTCGESGDLYLSQGAVAKRVRERENGVGTISFGLVSKKVAAK
jgi:hypothetical protein